MARIAVGAITISDISDGFNPISAVLTNQNHTFATDTSGDITTAERTAFDCEALVFVGETAATYDAGLTVNNTFRIDTFAGRTSGWALSNALGVLTMSTTPTGTNNTSEIFDIVMTVKNSVGNTTQITLILSVSKAIEGTGGAIITMNPNRQTFQFAEGETESTNADIVIPVSLVGNVGALTITYSQNGGAWAALNQGLGPNQAKALSVTDDQVENDSITISAANFANSDTFAVRVVGAAGGIDVISIVKIQDGDTGAASLHVSISSSTGGFSFKNNTGAAKTLTVKVLDMLDGSDITGSVTTFQWQKNGVNVGLNQATHVVTASDITDNGTEEYSCVVTI